MKSVKIASFLLASGMLLGTAHTGITSPYTVHAAQSQVLADEPKQVRLKDGDVDMDNGIIVDIHNMSGADKTALFNGGELVIPEKLFDRVTGVVAPVTGIGVNAFDKTAYSEGREELGIAKLTFDAPTNITRIDRNAFANNDISGELSLPEVTTIDVCAFMHNRIYGELDLPKVTTIGEYAFWGNAISGNLSLPEATTIGTGAFLENEISGKVSLEKIKTISESAFEYNHITDVYLPNAETIGRRAFLGNNLTKLKLEKVTSIAGTAFSANGLMDIDLPEGVVIAENAFLGQTFEVERTANEQGKVAFDELFSADEVPSLKKGGIAQKIKILRVGIYSVSNFDIDVVNETINLIDKNILTEAEIIVEFSNMTDFGDYGLLPLKLTIIPNDSSSGGDNENGGDGGDNENGGDSGDNENGEDGGDNENGGDGGDNENGGDGGDNENGEDGGDNENSEEGEDNVGDNENNEADISQTPEANTPDIGNNENPIVISPDPEVNRPHTVYAKRAMRLHSNVSLTSPTKSYKKQSRAKAPSFRVLGVSYDKSGKKRYKVKGGYITASTKYVADSHFRSSKVKQVRVIGNRVNSYKNVKLSKSQKVRSYKKGTKLKVKSIVRHGRTTRFRLNNGRYISANKQLSIMDHSK